MISINNKHVLIDTNIINIINSEYITSFARLICSSFSSSSRFRRTSSSIRSRSICDIHASIDVRVCVLCAYKQQPNAYSIINTPHVPYFKWCSHKRNTMSLHTHTHTHTHTFLASSSCFFCSNNNVGIPDTLLLALTSMVHSCSQNGFV